MEQVLLVVQVIITLALIVMVLIQRSDSDGFGLSGGSGNNLLSGRSTANFMTRTTAILATLFMANALLLGVIAARGHSSSIVETIEEQQADKPSVPAVPVEGETKAEKKADKKSDQKPAVETEKKTDEKAKPEVPKAGEKSVAEKKAEKKAEKSDEFDPNAATTNE
jgi:preprotein translocase subunit SecG